VAEARARVIVEELRGRAGQGGAQGGGGQDRGRPGTAGDGGAPVGNEANGDEGGEDPRDGLACGRGGSGRCCGPLGGGSWTGKPPELAGDGRRSRRMERAAASRFGELSSMAGGSSRGPARRRASGVRGLDGAMERAEQWRGGKMARRKYLSFGVGGGAEDKGALLARAAHVGAWVAL
jgi:hypothetical protein